MSPIAGGVAGVVGLLVGALVGLGVGGDQAASPNSPSPTEHSEDEVSSETATTPQTPTTASNTVISSTPATSSVTIAPASACSDDLESWAWPTTTEGPIVECPASPLGEPRSLILRPPAFGWISVLESIEIWDVAEVDPRDATLAQRDVVSLLDSRSYAGLRDPYWVLFAGPFDSRAAASAFCKDRPYLDPCYPRELG